MKVSINILKISIETTTQDVAQEPIREPSLLPFLPIETVRQPLNPYQAAQLKERQEKAQKRVLDIYG